MSENVYEILGIESPNATPVAVSSNADTSHPLYGVKGWLKFGVVMNLYVAPVLFTLVQVASWVGYTMLARRYPGIVLVGLFNTLAGSFLIVRGVQIARSFRNLRPRSVQKAKTLLKLAALYVSVSVPVSFLSGLRPEVLLPDILRSVLGTAIGFTVQYSYLNVSKRIAATFPDWKDK